MLNPFRILRRQLCPYCFEYFKLRETPFRCKGPVRRCALAPDAVFAEQWGDRRPRGRVIEATGRYRRRARCPACKGATPKRICPHCHVDLPHTTGRFRNYVFAIIGAKESGKSHYMAVLIEQLKKQVGPSFDMLLAELNDDTMHRYQREFHDPIYSDQRTISATRSALADQSVRRPLVYCLTILSKSFFGRQRRRVAVLVFFDSAGEDLDDEDVMSAVNRYIIRSDGILLLIDPLQLKGVRAKLSPDTGLPNVNTETGNILTRTWNLIVRGGDLSADDKVPIPLAVAFSKFDAVRPLAGEEFDMLGDAAHDGGFNGQDFEISHSVMRRLLTEEWDAPHIEQTARFHFEKYGFFGVSALGCNPHGSDHIPFVEPWRVEDPFLWLMLQNGLIEDMPRR